MEKRIVRQEDDLWRIRTDTGELPASERDELIEYFGEIKLNYRVVTGLVCIAGSIDRGSVFERLEHFYDGRAEVLPFWEEGSGSHLDYYLINSNIQNAPVEPVILVVNQDAGRGMDNRLIICYRWSFTSAAAQPSLGVKPKWLGKKHYHSHRGIILDAFPFTDNFLKTLSAVRLTQLKNKLVQIAARPGLTEDRLDRWFSNFRDQEQKEIAFKLFLEIEYFDEYRIRLPT